MIRFDEGNMRFNYRIVGVTIDSGRILAHKTENEDFWSLPGGKGELLETSVETLVREMQEELGLDIKVERLLWLVENFFAYDNYNYHELALYYLMTLPEDSYARLDSEFIGHEDSGVKLLFKWLPLPDLESLVLYPSFLREKLKNLPDTAEHVVHRDETL